jgi:outer membrane protein TolC
VVAAAPNFARAETLHSVVQHTLDTNPELQSLRYNRQAIDHELRAARGLNLPSVDATSGMAPTEQEQGRRNEQHHRE